jgi:hypothetical protein
MTSASQLEVSILHSFEEAQGQRAFAVFDIWVDILKDSILT